MNLCYTCGFVSYAYDSFSFSLCFTNHFKTTVETFGEDEFSPRDTTERLVSMHVVPFVPDDGILWDAALRGSCEHVRERDKAAKPLCASVCVG